MGSLWGSSRDCLVQGWGSREPEARRFGVPGWVRMGRRDAQGRAPGQTLQMTLNVKTYSTGNSEEPFLWLEAAGSHLKAR